MIFEIAEWTGAMLATQTNRVEKHGADDKAAVTWGLKIEAPNTILDCVSDTLRLGIYAPPPGGQKAIDGVAPVTPHLRSKDIEAVSIPGVFEGWSFEVDHGIEKRKPLVFGKCKVDKLRVEPLDGGSITLSLRIGTDDIDAERLGVIGMKLGQSIKFRLLKPLVKEASKPTDKGAPLFDGNGNGALSDTDNTPEKALAAAEGGKSNNRKDATQ